MPQWYVIANKALPQKYPVKWECLQVFEQYGNVVLNHVRRHTGMKMNSRMKERSEYDASNLCRVVCVCVCVGSDRAKLHTLCVLTEGKGHKSLILCHWNMIKDRPETFPRDRMPYLEKTPNELREMLVTFAQW